MKKMDDEHGYAALVAILVILLLTILGTSLLQTVMTSLTQVRKTETRGEAEYLARMGMDEAMARLTLAVEQINALVKDNPNWTMGPSDQIASNYDQIIKNNFPSVGSSETKPFNKFQKTPDGNWITSGPIPVESGVNGNYEILINRNVRNKWEDDSPYVERFLIRVIGRSTSVVPETRTLESKVYVNTYPGAFHYVLSAPQDIIVNGAAYVEGDAYANTFTMWNRAEYYYNDVSYTGSAAQLTSYPAFVGNIGVPFISQTDLKSNRFFYKNDLGQQPGTPFDDPDAKKLKSDWYKRFSLSPLLNLTMNPNFELTPISTIVSKKMSFTITAPSVSNPYASDGLQRIADSSKTFTDSVLIDSGLLIKDDSTLDSQSDVEINGTLIMDKDEDNDGNAPKLKAKRVYIHGSSGSNTASTTLRGNVETEQYLYIKGDAVIQDLHFKGKMYIDGNLTIQGNFDMNGTIYVNGTVDITEEDASTNWTPEPNTAVVILCSGKFEAYNINLFNNTNRQLSAFLYSEQDMILYGIGSNMTFFGGLHGRSITLNAVKGNVSETGSGTLNFTMNQDSLKPNDDSRLRIIFNPALYDSPPPGLPTSRIFTPKMISYELDSFDEAHMYDVPPDPTPTP